MERKLGKGRMGGNEGKIKKRKTAKRGVWF